MATDDLPLDHLKRYFDHFVDERPAPESYSLEAGARKPGRDVLHCKHGILS